MAKPKNSIDAKFVSGVQGFGNKVRNFIGAGVNPSAARTIEKQALHIATTSAKAKRLQQVNTHLNSTRGKQLSNNASAVRATLSRKGKAGDFR